MLINVITSTKKRIKLDLMFAYIYNIYMILKYIVKNNKYSVLRQVIKNEFHISKRLTIKLKENNCIRVNNSICYMDFPLKNGDIITVTIDFNEESENIVATNIPINILYEDDYYLVINKTPHIPVHPSASHYSDSLSNGIKYYFEKNNIHRKIRPVNRLDKDTSGIVIFAKNEYIQECLIKQMLNKEFKKTYIGILEGNMSSIFGTINAPIARKENSIIERCVDNSGEKAITHYTLLKNLDNFCIVEFQLETGRTHQIRVHSAYIKHPIIGDTLYGNISTLINRQALHAYKVKFTHPINHKEVEYVADIPEDMRKIVDI